MDNRKLKTTSIIMGGLLMALSVVLTRFLYIMPTETMRFSLGAVPIILSGIIYGPLIGGMVGLGADFLGVIINSMGKFHPGFMLSSMLTGLIPGLYSKLMINDRVHRPNEAIAGSIITITIIVSIVLNTYWLVSLTGIPFLTQLTVRGPKSIIDGIIYFIATRFVYLFLEKSNSLQKLR